MREKFWTANDALVASSAVSLGSVAGSLWLDCCLCGIILPALFLFSAVHYRSGLHYRV